MNGGLQFIPTHVPCFTEVQKLRKVGVPNAYGAQYVHDLVEGRVWVLKNDMATNNLILAEAIGFELSRLLNIPTPSPALLDQDGEYRWMTECLDNVLHWHPARKADIANLEDVGAMLTLDVIVGNEDRNERNILLQARDSKFTAYSIDLERSWTGSADDIGRRAPDELPPAQKAFDAQIPLAELGPAMASAAEACKALTHEVLAGRIQPWCNLLGETSALAIIEAVASRCSRANALVDARVCQIQGSQ